MASHGYHCRICKQGTFSENMWFRHLLEEPHQSLTREDCIKWGEGIRERSLVAYSSIPVVAGEGESGETLLQFLSNDRTLVSDFVWSSDNPTIAIVQLQNKQAVQDVVSTKGETFSVTCDLQVNIRRGVELVGIQWPLLLSSMKVKGTQRRSGVPYPLTSSSRPVLRSRSKPLGSITSNNIPVRNPTPLSVQVDFICKSVQLTEELINAAQNIVTVLETILKGCSVNILRGWKFKLDYSNYLLLYVTKRIPNEEVTRNLSQTWKSEQISSLEVRDQILSSELQFKVVEIPIPNSERKERGIGTRFQFHTGFTFNYVTFDTFIIEAQLSRLIQYMCTFDQRCIPLLSLVHHWASFHEIRLHESNDLLINDYTFHCIGEPAALEWMVMLFMCREGYIPTPRQIQSRPHCAVPLPQTDVDLGFTDDPKFAKTWKAKYKTVSEESKEEFALSVVKLAQEFFSLFGTVLASGSWILNTRDGQLLSTFELLFNGEPIPEKNSHFSQTGEICLEKEELDILKDLHNSSEHGIPVNFDDLNSFRIYVVNPLYFRWRLSLCNTQFPRICKTMYQTGESLLEFLKIWERAYIDKVDMLLSDFL